MRREPGGSGQAAGPPRDPSGTRGTATLQKCPGRGARRGWGLPGDAGAVGLEWALYLSSLPGTLSVRRGDVWMRCPAGSPVCRATFSRQILSGWVLARTPTPTFLARASGRPFSWLSSLPLMPRAELFPLGAPALPQCPRIDCSKGSAIPAAPTWRVPQISKAGGPSALRLFSQLCASPLTPSCQLGLLF